LLSIQTHGYECQIHLDQLPQQEIGKYPQVVVVSLPKGELLPTNSVPKLSRVAVSLCRDRRAAWCMHNQSGLGQVNLLNLAKEVRKTWGHS